MHLGLSLRKLLGVIVSIGLLAVLACGPSEEATPTPTTPDAPTPTPTAQLVVPEITVPTPTPTLAPGVTAVPQPTNTPTPVPEVGGPVYGGTTAIGVSGVGSPGQFDFTGNTVGYGWTGLGFAGNVWGQLLRFSLADKQTVENDLAESWSLDADGTTYRFQLRNNIYDHEGNQLTAEDAAYSLYRYIERPNSLSSKRQGCLRAYVDDVEALSDTELVVRLKAPRAAFLACFVSPWTAIMPDTYTRPIDESGTWRDVDFAQGEVVGTGPFMLTVFEDGNRAGLERNPNYFLSEYPYLDGYEVLAIPDANTRTAALYGGAG